MYENTLSDFFKTIQNHDWITHSHICIYTAILELWHQNKYANPVPISRHKLMNMSKVSATATYHKCIKELVTGKYISYYPSYNPYHGSLVYILKSHNQNDLHGLNFLPAGYPWYHSTSISKPVAPADFFNVICRSESIISSPLLKIEESR